MLLSKLKNCTAGASGVRAGHFRFLGDLAEIGHFRAVVRDWTGWLSLYGSMTNFGQPSAGLLGSRDIIGALRLTSRVREIEDE
jgi:hypothetical protein